MFIVTVDGEGLVQSYLVPASPLTIKEFAGDPTRIFIDRSQFTSRQHVLYFRRNYWKFKASADGTLTRTVL